MWVLTNLLNGDSMSKKIILSLLLFFTTVSVHAKKGADWQDLPSQVTSALGITGPAPEFYAKNARRLLTRFNLKDPFSVYLVETTMHCGGFACWCDLSWGQVVIGERYKILALETEWIKDLAYGSKMMLLAHEISHMVDFQRFGIEKFYQARTDFCSRVVEEHADQMALVMVCCSECMNEQGDLWKLLAQTYGISEKTADTESGSHPNLVRRAKYHYSMAKSYDGVLCDHHLMAQYDDKRNFCGMKSSFYSSHTLSPLELDHLYKRFTGQSCCQSVASNVSSFNQMVGK